MAYDNNYRRGGNQPQQRGPSGYNGFRQPEPPPEIRAEALPEDYVDAAEQVIREICKNNKKITTSKLRNLFSLVTDIYNVENLRTEPALLPESKTALTKMRIRIAYEAGREQTVKDFVLKAKLLEYIKGVGNDRQRLIDFANYMEALVAYHRFLIGGREG